MRKYRAVITLEFVVLIVLIMVLFYALMGISTVQGNSMYPILHSDTVNIQNGKLYVNGAEEKQEGTLGETLTEENNQVSYPLTVGDDQIFVLGDNREVSDDSRAFGVVDMDDVKGRIVWYMGRL